MPRKVFISFLGTNNYRPCTYTKDGQLFGPTRFIQEATLSYLLSTEEWTLDDRVLILLTPQAESKNWVDSYTQDNDTPSEGLSSRLSHFPVIVETIKNLPEGVNEEEIWTIFSKIYDYIHEGDILYFDLTHGYRYLPMLILVLGNYTKFLKGIQIRSITYGNWEISQNGAIPAPIIDLLPLSALQEWTYAAGQFIESGNADQLFELSRQEYAPVLQDSYGADPNAKRIKDYVNSLKHLVDDTRSCRAISIIEGNFVKLLKDTYQELPNSTLRPYQPIFQKVEESFQSFSAFSNPTNGLKAAKWCIDKGLYQQAATYLEESVLYIISRHFDLSPLNDTHMGLISGAFNYAFQRKKKDNCINGYSVEQITLGEKLLIDYDAIIYPFTELREKIRNDFNHAGIRQVPLSYTTLIKILRKDAEIIIDFFRNRVSEFKSEPREAILINLSNHPSHFWSVEQLKAAEYFGRVIDRVFPNLDPSLDEKEIDSLATCIVNDYLDFDPHYCTFHIMGEMTLTYKIVSTLKALGFKCLASTAKRNVRYNDSGEKIVVFDFVSFREY